MLLSFLLYTHNVILISELYNFTFCQFEYFFSYRQDVSICIIRCDCTVWVQLTPHTARTTPDCCGSVTRQLCSPRTLSFDLYVVYICALSHWLSYLRQTNRCQWVVK